jgi:hypothetical protein
MEVVDRIIQSLACGFAGTFRTDDEPSGARYAWIIHHAYFEAQRQNEGVSVHSHVQVQAE